MKLYLLRLHHRLLLSCVGGISIISGFMLFNGERKSLSSLDWADILGESGIAAFPLVWLVLILMSRPAGRVTNYLVLGLAFVHFAALIDFLDEFRRYPDHGWITKIDSLPGPVGMILITVGLYFWHKEQLILNEQMRRRERYVREHSLSDYVTGLYSAEYMINQVQYELTKRKTNGQHFSLLMLDVDQFDRFTRCHGDRHGDRLLREIAELILMNIRETDLACRYSGDRFIVLLPDTTLSDSLQMAKQLENAIAHLAFKPAKSMQAIYHSISVSVVDSQKMTDIDALLSELNVQMERAKFDKYAGVA